jgi:hypothetical protein
VRRIFSLACDGKGPTEIANILNADGVLTPSDYNKKNGRKLTVTGITSSMWSSGNLIRILRDERYTGVFIAGKSDAGKLGTGAKEYKSKEEWIRIPDTHPAIIAHETWDTVVESKKKYVGQHNKPNTARVLYKRVRCGYCGHLMRFRADGKRRYYYCETLRYTNEYGCVTERYPEDKLVAAVKAVTQMQVKAMTDMEKICRDGEKGLSQSADAAKAVAKRLDGEIEQLQTLKRRLYERYKNGSLEKAAYFAEREAVEADIAVKTSERDALLAKSDEQEGAIHSAQYFFGSFLEYQVTTEPSDEMVNAFVNDVRIFAKDRIEVQFSFRDELEQAMFALEGLRQENIMLDKE